MGSYSWIEALERGQRNRRYPTNMSQPQSLDMPGAQSFVPSFDPEDGSRTRTGGPIDWTWDRPDMRPPQMYSAGSWPPIRSPQWAQPVGQGVQSIARSRQRGGGSPRTGGNVTIDPIERGGQQMGQPGQQTGQSYQGWQPQPPNIPYNTDNPNATFQGMHNYQTGWMPPGLYQNLINQSMNPYSGPYNDPRYMPWSNQTMQGIGGYMSGTNPVMQQYQGQFPGAGQNLNMITGQIDPYLLQSGLAGQKVVLDENQFRQNQDWANRLYGNTDLAMQDFFSRGMEGREQMQNLFNPQPTGGYARTGLDYLLQNGAPNRGEIESRVPGWGQQGDTMSDLAGGAYRHLMTNEGLPGQVTMQDLLLPGQQGTFQALQGQNIGNVDDLIAQAKGGGPGIQGTVGNTLQQMISGGGLTPEYIQAMRNQVYEPGMEQLMGRINQQLGGEGELSSGLSAELQRRAERDFQDQLIRAGMGNLSTAIGQGTQLGGQQYGQQANAIGMQGNLAQQSFNNQFDMFNALATQGRGLISDVANFGQQGTDNMFRGYETIPQTELPFLQMGLNQGQQDITNMFGARKSLMDEGFGITDRAMQYGGQWTGENQDAFRLNALPMDLINDVYNRSAYPFSQYANYQQRGYDQATNVSSQMSGDQSQQYQQALQLAQLMQGGGINMAGLFNDYLGRMMTGEYGESAAGKASTGNMVAGGINVGAAFLEWLASRNNNGYNTNPYGGYGGGYYP